MGSKYAGVRGLRVFAISLAAVMSVIALSGAGLHLLFGMHFKRRSSRSETERSSIGARAAAVMRAVGADPSSPVLPDTVPIVAFNQIYASLGVTSRSFAVWEQKHGMDSLGIAPDGAVFIPGFPVLSKVAWMYVDLVTLSRTETLALVEECERAASAASNATAKEELSAMSVLARRASAMGAVISFGP